MKLPFVLLLLPYFWWGCHALIGHSHIFLRNDAPCDFDSFGFEQGGTLSISAKLDPAYTNTTFYFCTDKEFEVMQSNSQQETSKLCSGVEYCDLSRIPLDKPIDYVVQSTDLYHLVLVKCGTDEEVSVEVDYVLLNPGNLHLGLGYAPLPVVYIILTSLWSLVVFIAAVDWMRNRRHLVMLHSLFAVVGFLKLAVVSVAVCYWRIFEVTGEGIVPLKFLQSFLFAVSETAFFCSLMLISKGWRITRSNLPPSEIRTISVALVLLLSTLLFFSFYNEGYYFLSLMIMYFFMLPKIFTSITRNTRALQTQMLLIRYVNVEVNMEPLLAKMKMFKTLRTSVILYLGSILMVSSMRIIMLWFLYWVNFCVSESIALIMVAIVCFLLRPRENGVFSPRAYLEGNPLPILNIQNFDHFDEIFGDQLWDPEMLLMNANALGNGSPFDNSSDIDMGTTIVLEYPSPFRSENDKTIYYPHLAIATLEKQSPPPDNNSSNNPTQNSSSNNSDSVQMQIASSSTSNVPSHP